MKAQKKIAHYAKLMHDFRNGFVYVIEQYPYAKVGYSASPLKRLRGMQTASAVKLRLLGVCLGSMELEKAIHKILQEAGIACRGEWYLLEDIKHLFDTMDRLTAAAIAYGAGEKPSTAEPCGDGYKFRFQWCCHNHWAYRGPGEIYTHLVNDHDLDHEQALEMAALFRDDPTRVGVCCVGKRLEEAA
jgi:hypothetical protein